MMRTVNSLQNPRGTPAGALTFTASAMLWSESSLGGGHRRHENGSRGRAWNRSNSSNGPGASGGGKSRRRSVSWLLMVVGIMAIAIGGTLATLQQNDAKALAPCLAHTNTTEELTFLGQLQAWRDQNIPGSFPLTLSAPLTPLPQAMRSFWRQRPGRRATPLTHRKVNSLGGSRLSNVDIHRTKLPGAKGLAVVESSGPSTYTGTQALTIMTADDGGGVCGPAIIGANVECVGLAKINGLDGSKVAWVVELFATFDTCPQAVIGGGGGTAPSPSTFPIHGDSHAD